MGNLQWEMFHDDSYYGMYAVRPVDDKSFNSPRLFHFAVEADAKAFKDLASRAFCSKPVIVESCPDCSIDGTLYNKDTGKWDIICPKCKGTGKLP